VTGVAFSPDGRRIVSSSNDTTLRLWDADTGKPIGAPLTGHTDKIFGVAFSPDGHRLVSGSVDGSLRLWDADTGQTLGAPIRADSKIVFAVAFSPDGRQVLSGGADGTLRLWPTPPTDTWPKLLCDKLTYNMSHDQWRNWVSPDIDYVEVCPGLPVAADG
jgi:WD40 repeat protein